MTEFNDSPYFKRSYNADENAKLAIEEEDKNLISKIYYPLGFNYHVTSRGNPQDKYIIGNIRQIAHNLLNALMGGKPRYYFTEDKIHDVKPANTSNPVVLFFCSFM